MLLLLLRCRATAAPGRRERSYELVAAWLAAAASCRLAAAACRLPFPTVIRVIVLLYSLHLH